MDEISREAYDAMDGEGDRGNKVDAYDKLHFSITQYFIRIYSVHYGALEVDQHLQPHNDEGMGGIKGPIALISSLTPPHALTPHRYVPLLLAGLLLECRITHREKGR
ncbi:hypothetical protein CBL_00888 [Carabus blaptoides fortunei]